MDDIASRSVFSPGRRAFAAALFLVLSCGGAAAQVARIDRAEVIEDGRYTLTPGPGGSVPAATLVEASDVVPAQVGAQFGFRYILAGEPPEAPVNL